MNNEEAAQVLICHHANVDLQDEYNQTALFLAAREGSFQVAQILLQLGRANTDLPDHMDRFPRDVAMERQHDDIAQLIEEYSHGPPTGSGLSTLSSPAAGVSSMAGMQASASKSRSKKSSGAGQRKQLARHVVDDGVLRHPLETDPAHQRPKKPRRQRVAVPQAVPQSQMQSAAKFSVEQPPSYENAINGRRAQAAMQRSAAGVGVDAQPIYHTGLAFEEPPQQFEAGPGMACAGMMATEAVGFHPQPTGVVLRPSAYLTGGRLQAELSSHMVHNSPTVPSCQAYSPPGMAALHGPEMTVVRAGHHGPQLQMLPQREHLHQSQYPRHHHHQHQHSQHHLALSMTSETFDVSSTAFVSVPGSTTYAVPTPSSAVAGTMFLYPSPPSHHSATETTSPPLIQPTSANHPNYPTPPSQEALEPSPGQWSSSSPNSAKSDWSSEQMRNRSPHRVVINPNNQGIKDEPAYV